MPNQWNTIDLLDIEGGMSTNAKYPSNKFAKRLLNVTHAEIPGALVLRPGYSLKYALPTNPTIENSQYVNFDIFYDKQASPEGEEITCVIQKGILRSLKDSSGGYILPNEQVKGFWFWVNPFWNGGQWAEGWQWLNRTIITKIISKHSNYGCSFTIYGGALQGIVTNGLVGWTIYNKTKGEKAKIITSVTAGSETTINITKNINVWEANDVIIVSRQWIDLGTQLEYYNNVKKEDITFHRINNDLKIGFGGYKDRPGISIGYRKNYLLLDRILFNLNYNGDLNEALKKFCETDGVILVKNTLDKEDIISLTPTATGTTPAGKYSFKLVGVIDGHIRQLTDTAEITLVSEKDIILKIETDISDGNLVNQRLTDFELYSAEEEVYYKLSLFKIRGANFTDRSLILNENGMLKLREGIYVKGTGNPHLHINPNCTNPSNENHSIGSWRFLNNTQPPDKLKSVSSARIVYYSGGSIVSKNIIADNGAYFLTWKWSPNEEDTHELKSPVISDFWRKCKIKFSILINRDVVDLLNPNKTLSLIVTSTDIHPTNMKETTVIDLPRSMDKWKEIEMEMEVSGSLSFSLDDAGSLGYAIFIDNLSVTTENYQTTKEEITEAMGYHPTFNVVRGWDKVLIKDGRAYYFNPYVEERLDNFILVSHIAPPSTFLYDIATTENLREIEKNDNSNFVTAEMLPNKEILILKDSSIISLVDDGRVGVVREPLYGVDCVSKDSVVNINGTIFWCGKEEIYVLNLSSSYIPQPILKQSIRDLYLAIEDKTKIFGTRNRLNTYKIRINNADQKTEYLLTSDGWVEERKYNFPEIYRYGFKGRLYFLSGNSIYEEYIDYSLPTSNYGEF